MELKSAILRAGAYAVELHKRISGCTYENELAERFLTSLMAVHLHEALPLVTKVERPYETIADELGVNMSAEARNTIRQLTADIALYEGDRPVATVEVKEFAERAHAGQVYYDLHKGDPCDFYQRFKVFVAAMVCEVPGRNPTARRAELERIRNVGPTACEWLYSPAFRARDAQWEWCLGCGSLKCA